MPRVVSVGRGMRLVKPMPVMKKTEEMKGMGKTKIRELVLKEDVPRKYIGHKIAVSNRDIQSPNSTMCGYFCLACDYYMTYETDRQDIYQRYDDFINMFKVDTRRNDFILTDYLESVGLSI